jgi:hypothetical protein
MRRIGTIKHLIQDGGMTEVEDDVLNIVRRVHSISPRLTVYWNDYIDKFTITETSLDGSTERLVFHVTHLDERALVKLQAADHWNGREDPEHVLADDQDFVAALDAAQAVVDKEKDEAFREKQQELKEPFVAYSELDGRGIRAQILVPRSLDG